MPAAPEVPQRTWERGKAQLQLAQGKAVNCQFTLGAHEWNRSPFNFIPQGGGDFELGHRFAGEWLTIALVKAAVRLLVSDMDYQVPKQNLRIGLSRMPAIPESRFIIRKVRRRQQAADQRV